MAVAHACLEKLRKAVSDTAGKKALSTEVERLFEGGRRSGGCGDKASEG